MIRYADSRFEASTHVHDDDAALRLSKVAYWGLYASIALYFASLIIFARPENVIFSNIANLLMLAVFLAIEFFYSDRTLYVNSVTVAYALFFLYCLLSLFWTIDYEVSDEMIGRMVKIMINLFFVYNILKKYRMVTAVLIGLFVGTLVNILIALHKLPVPFSPYFPGTDRFMGTTFNPNITSSFMFYSIFVSIVVLEITERRIFLLTGMLNIILSYFIILLTVSRTGLVVALFFILAFLVASMFHTRRRKYIFAGLGLFAVAALLTVDAHTVARLEHLAHFAVERIGYIFDALSGEATEHSADERLAFIRVALQTFNEHPVFGTGVDTVRSYQGVYSHNNYTELLANNGLIGFALYYAMHLFALLKAWRVRDPFLRFFLIMFILSVLLYDMGGVSYYSKLTLMMLVLASYIAEEFDRYGEKARARIL